MLEFIGRIDDQVKIRGFRVELGEIESVLGMHPDLREVVVDAQDTGTSGKRLVAYTVPGQRGMPSANELRQWAGRDLPAYMVPGVFVDVGRDTAKCQWETGPPRTAASFGELHLVR